jgi:hypothetical protein
MQDTDLDRWLAERNARLTARISEGIDLTDRRTRVRTIMRAAETANLRADTPTLKATDRPPHRRRRVLIAVAAVGIVVGGLFPAFVTIPQSSTGPVAAAGLPSTHVPAPPTYTTIAGPESLFVPVPPGLQIIYRTDQSVMITDMARSGLRIQLSATAANPADLMKVSDYERSIPASSGYVRLTLEEVDTPTGHKGVLWEYQLRENGVLRQTSVLYWQQNGHDYTVSVAAPASQWPELAALFTTMLSGTEVRR